MGIRPRRWTLLASGSSPTPDRSTPVEIAEVPLADGPMLVSALQAAGFEAVGVESFDLVTKVRSRMRILVRRADAAAAQAADDRMR